MSRANLIGNCSARPKQCCGGFMTQEEKHVELLKAAYQKWHDSKAGSVDYWLGLMTDDIKFRSLGAGAAEIEFTRTSTCKEEVKRYFAGLTWTGK
jgi:hypothetical protein